MSSTSKQSPAPTELWYTRCPVPTASGIAQRYGWLHDELARHGITLRSIRSAGDRSVRDSHFNHSHPGMFREGGNIPPIAARASGQNTAVVGITWVDEEQAILVRGDSAIANAGDLRGRRLGLPKSATHNIDFSRAMALRGFVTALSIAGLAPTDAEIVDIASGDIDLQEDYVASHPRNAALDALLAGEVDAIYAKGSRGSALVARHGLRRILDINAQKDPVRRINNGTPRPVTVDRDLALHHPEIVARYLAVLLRTAEWAKTHRDETVAAVALETASSADDVLRAYGPQMHQRFEIALSPDRIAALENQKNFLRDWGFLAGDFDFAAWIVPEPLALARQIAATESLPLGLAAAE